MLDRLKKYAAAERKKRYLNFISTQYIMLKYKRIALKHWQLLFKHHVNKRRKMAGTLEFLYKVKLADSLGTLEHFYGRKVKPRQVLKT